MESLQELALQNVLESSSTVKNSTLGVVKELQDIKNELKNVKNAIAARTILDNSSTFTYGQRVKARDILIKYIDE